VRFDRSAPGHVVVRTSFGLYDTPSLEAGPREGWRWLCSAAIGYDANEEDPALTIAGGHLVVGTFDGLVVGTSDRCGYELVPVTKDRYVVDLAALPTRDAPAPGSPVLALASNGVGEDRFEVRLFESTDDASTWKELSASLPEDFLALSVAAAPKKSDLLTWGTIYLSGRDGRLAGGYHAVLFRSDDGGASWQRLEVAGVDGLAALPYLQGVLPTEPPTVFVSAVLDAPPTREQRNLVSRDGGASFASYAEAKELMPGFALSPDGTRVAFGGEKTGLMVAPTDALEDPTQAKKLQTTRVACLSWQDDGLYVCGNAFVDGFSVGRSTDDGVTFEPVTFLTSACGPKTCDPASDVGNTCGPLWAIEANELVAPLTCDPPPPPIDESGCSVVPGDAERVDPAPLALVGLAVAGTAVRRRRRR
jgi:MYXO-CTERM domain-containing protein